MRALIAIALLLLSFGIVPAAQAGTLFVTDEVVAQTSYPDCQTIPTYGMVDDPPAAAAEMQKAYLTIGVCPVPFQFTADVPFTITEDASFQLFIGCDEAAIGPSVPGATRSVLVTFLHNDEAVSQVDSTDPIVCTGSGSSFPVTGAFATKDLAIAPGDTLTVTINTFFATNPPPDVAPNLHVQAYAEGFLSGITAAGIPAAIAPPPAGTATFFEPITGERLQVQKEFTDATNAVYVHNWTAVEGDLTGMVNATVAEGSVTAVLRDADGAVLFTNSWTSDGGEALEIDGDGGDWSLTVTYSGFAGSFQVDLGQGPAPTTATPTRTTTPTAGTPTTGTPTVPTNDDDGDGGEGDGEGDDTPAASFVALAAALLTAAIVLRRRR